MITLKKMVTFTFYLLVPAVLMAQPTKKANVWYFGENAGIDFSSGTAVALTNGAMKSSEGTTTVSDVNGQLLFYTNGGDFPYDGGVWNRNHQLMPNGDLSGAGGCNSSFQSSMVLKSPGNPNAYYIFTTDCQEHYFADGLSYSIVDMNLDGGLGDVVTKGVKLTGSVTESLAAVKHGNGKDYWILTHKVNTDTFYVYKLTTSGISGVVKSKAGPVAGQFAAEIDVASNGEKLVHHGTSYTALFDFNNMTGVVSNHKNLAISSSFGAFSPDCKYYYASNMLDRNIYQFDVTNREPAITKTIVGNTGSNLPGAIKLGPDGKLYVAKNNATTLSVIEKPNLPGVACSFQENGFDLLGKKSKSGLPNYANDVVGECLPYIKENMPTTGVKPQTQLQIYHNYIGISVTNLGGSTGYNYKVTNTETGDVQHFNNVKGSLQLQNLAEYTEYEIVVESSTDEKGVTFEYVYGHDTDHIMNSNGEVDAEDGIIRATTQQKFDFDVYPNPARGQAHISVELGENDTRLELNIYDASGRRVYNQKMENASNIQNITIPTEQLPNGVYNIAMSTETMRSNKKIVVMN